MQYIAFQYSLSNSSNQLSYILCLLYVDKELSMDDACNHKSPMVFTILNKTDVHSPYYPKPYPNNIDCTWKVLAVDSFRIQLKIEEGGQIDIDQFDFDQLQAPQQHVDQPY